MVKVPLPVVPDPDDDDALQSWIDVVADGVPLRAMVDTGARRSQVPGVEPFSTRVVQGTSDGRGVSGSSSNDPLVRLHRLQVGDLTVADLTVGVQPPDWPHPPLVGMDVLGSHACHFRFDVEELQLDAPSPRAEDWIALTTEPHRQPTVDVRWESTTVSAIWDTGAGMTVVDRGWAQAHPDAVTILPGSRDGTDATGAQMAAVEGRLAPHAIGPLGFGEEPCALIDISALNAHLTRPIHMILGLPQISRASWYMDFPRRRWTVTSTSVG